MVWFYERGGQQARVEILPLVTNRFELRFVDASGTEHVEELASADDVAERLREVEGALHQQGWSRSGEWVV